MSNSTNQRMTIVDFLFRRLKEARVRHLFGVPGDYNLELLQQLYDTGALQWIGTCSELNASYAANRYARLNGLEALLVTNGVGNQHDDVMSRSIRSSYASGADRIRS